MSASLVNTLLLAQQHLCGPNLIRNFACELPPVISLACSDPYSSIISILTTMVVLGLGTLVLLLGSYSHVIMTALGINSATGRGKIFSTCSSHVLVVIIFYGSGISRELEMNLWKLLNTFLIFCDLKGNKKEIQVVHLNTYRAVGSPQSIAANCTVMIILSSVCSSVQLPTRYMTVAPGSALEQVLSMQYSVVTPLLNPFIYSLKNKEVKAALRRVLARKSRLTF
ncbi:Olfactory receptor 10A4 [Heterocephalus glaber]|uniref:Olfactory receptor 10A4 n=1 Tax=Heterocephalus glaber TaxID=10181 RepID=G5AU52_HETGA|nr:Olfactory receptor 10A4 [Heterocephalus glaber]